MSDSGSSGATTASSKPPTALRTFSWTRWLVYTTVLASLAYYFIRASARVKAVSIAPTPILDALVGFGPATAYQTLRALGPKGREIYREINKVDFILTPIVLRECLLNTLPPSSVGRNSIREILANTYAVGDLLENIGVAIMLKAYPRIPDVVVWAGCVGNLAKWFGLGAAVLSIVYEGVLWITRLKAKKQ